jgi:hypothetical protein
VCRVVEGLGKVIYAYTRKLPENRHLLYTRWFVSRVVIDDHGVVCRVVEGLGKVIYAYTRKLPETPHKPYTRWFQSVEFQSGLMMIPKYR